MDSAVGPETLDAPRSYRHRLPRRRERRRRGRHAAPIYLCRGGPSRERRPAVDGWLTFRVFCEKPGRLQLAYFSQEIDLLPAAQRAQPLRLILDGAETAVPAGPDPVGLIGGVDLTPALAQQIATAREAAFWGPSRDVAPVSGGDAAPLRRVARDCAV